MTFNELCNQTSRELGMRVHKDDVYEVMYTAFRVGIEELAINPSRAEIFIHGVGRFYLTYYKNDFNGHSIDGKKREYKPSWRLRFKPSERLKKIINGKIPLENMAIGGHYLFPEFHTTEDGMVENYRGHFKPKEEKKREIKHTNEYWLKQIEKIKQGKLEVKPDGTIGKVEKRGRPRNKLTQYQIRSKVMREMRRDMRREAREQRKREQAEKEKAEKENGV